MDKHEAGEQEIADALAGMRQDYILVDELERMLATNNPPVVIDLRETVSCEEDHVISAAINISMENLVSENLEKAIPDKSTPVVLVCAHSFGMTRMIPLTTYAYPTLKLYGYRCVKVLTNPVEISIP